MLATQRAASRPRRRAASASSTPRPRRSTASAETLPTPEDTLPRPISPYGVTKLAGEHLCRLVHDRASASTSSRCATSRSTGRASGPTWRSRASCRRSLEGAAVRRSTATAARRAQLHLRRRRRRAPRSRRWSARRAGAVYNVGGGAETSMRDAIALLERIAGRTLDLGPRRSPRATCARTAGRHDADPRRARLGAARSGSRTACARSGCGRRRGWPRDEPAGSTRCPTSTPSRRSTSAATRAPSSPTGGCRCLGIVVGILAGYALALGGGKVYQAEARVYLGNPFSPNGGASVPSLATNPEVVSEIVRSESAISSRPRGRPG